MARGILRLAVKEITVEWNGDDTEGKKPGAGSEKNNAIVASLRYPRSGAPAVVSSLAADLESGVLAQFDLGDFWKSGLFKEEMDSETVLTIQVLDRDATSKVAKVIASLSGTILTAGLGAIVGGISNAIVGAVAALPVDALGATFKLDKEAITVLGEAKRELKAGEIPDEIELTLKVPKAIGKDYYKAKYPGDTKMNKKNDVIFKKDAVMGTIVLAAKWEPL